MSERPIAMYDDLGLAPDTAFDMALRQRLEARMLDRSPRATPGVIDIELDGDLPLSPDPEPGRQSDHGRSRRAVLAMAAAIVASVAVGVIVDQLVIDDSSDPPALTVPGPTSPPATIPVSTTTTTEPFLSDDNAASRTLLGFADYVPGFTPLPDWLPVTLDGSVAEQLPACQQFARTVFESESRPAVIKSRVFENDDGTYPYLMVQYVAVHPTVTQAARMLDGMQDPEFLAECVPAYTATRPPCSQTTCDVENWFPIYTGVTELETPSIATGADDVWVRRYTGSPVTDAQGVTHDNPGEFAFAAVRVGRIVATIDVVLIDFDGRRVATVDDFQAIVQRLAVRAAGAQ
jgi:hypothetical protein